MSSEQTLESEVYFSLGAVAAVDISLMFASLLAFCFATGLSLSLSRSLALFFVHFKVVDA